MAKLGHNGDKSGVAEIGSAHSAKGPLTGFEEPVLSPIPDQMINTRHLPMDLERLRQRLREFARERDWEQFHSPKNLATALAIEAAELLEPFQWMKEEDSRNLPAMTEEYRQVREEIADVLIYLVRLADQLGVDLEEVVEEKLIRNAEKYPVHLARGRSVKYDRLHERDTPTET